MVVSLINARAAITSISAGKGLEAAYRSYASGHDDKHRSKAKSYSYNFESSSGNEPSSFYQKISETKVPLLDDHQQQIFTTATVSAWGKTKDVQVPQTQTVSSESDISQTQELELLKTAFVTKPPVLYKDLRDPNSKFIYACFMPSGFAGYTFSGGGKQFPKQASACNAMAVIIACGGNAAIVTHYPVLVSNFKSWTKLT